MTDVPDLTRFGPEGAWLLGSRLVEACRACALPVAIDIRLGSQQVFHAALPGSSADNDRWARRKGRIAWHFGLPSLEVWRRYVGDAGDPMAFLAAFALPAEEYFPAGGAVPIRVGGALVGVLAVSGLESSEDHALAVAALRELANESQGQHETQAAPRTPAERRRRRMTNPAARTGRVGLGLIGAGMISDTYLDNLTSFPDVEVLMVSDRDVLRAQAQAEKHGVPAWGGPDDVLGHPDIELVVNLTIPAAHAQVSSAAIAAGKHVWSEKPLGIARESARQVRDDAARAGVLVGVAPDTLLGPGFQSARRAIERGDIGVPLSAQTVFQYPGPDLFHPNPEFLFAQGAGPLFDIGPYYLTALAHLFGSYASVAAVGTKSRETRIVQAGDRAGTEFAVEAPTLVQAVASFSGGQVAQTLFSFDSPMARTGYVEITGTEATMLVPDPNLFAGSVRLTRPVTLATVQSETEWIDVPVPDETYGRGAGALDLARCIRGGGEPIASGELGYHVLDVMASIEESIASGQTVRLASSTAPVPLLPEGWNPHEATLGAEA